MSRGRVDVYDIGSYSPQATGVPNESRAAGIVAGSIQNFGKVLEQREQKKAELEATAKLGDFDLEYSKLKMDLQRQYYNEPEKYPEKLREESLKLRDKYTEGLSGLTADQFATASNRYLTNDITSAATWSATREKEKIIGSIQEGYQNIALKSETDLTPDSLKQRLNGGIDDPFSLTAQNEKAKAFLNESSVLELNNRTRSQIVENGMDSRIVANAAKTYQDLASGQYDEVLTADEKRKYLESSRTAMTSMAMLEQYRGLTTAAVEVSTLIDAFNAGQLSVGDINRTLMWAELNKNKKNPVTGENIISDNYLRGLQRLRDISLTQDFRTKEAKETDKIAFSQEFDTKWNAFLLGKGPNAKASAKDYDDVIGLYADLLDAYNSRKIDQTTFESRKKILDTVNKNRIGKEKVATLTEALQKAGKYSWFWFDRPNDVYSVGYSMIQTYLDKSRPDLSQVEKLNLRDQLLLEYTRRVEDIPEEQRKNKKQVATQLLFGGGNSGGVIPAFSIYTMPNGQQIRPGQVVDTGQRGVKGVFLGVDAKTGLLKIAPAKNLVKELET